MSILQANSAGLGGKGDPGGALGSFYSTTIDQSLRFNDNDSAYLNRTFASAGNQQIWTWSGWVKRGNLASGSAGRNTIFSGSGTQIFGFMNPTTNATADNFGCYLTDSEDDRFMTNRVFRDVNSWYHLVVTFNSTASSNDDRFRLWVNGVQETSWSRFDTITQNRTTGINAAAVHAIGVQANASSQFFDGYMAEVNFIDGTALDPTSFGETINGIWVPKQYSGSYGTNGFYLPFAQDVSSGSSTFFSDSGNSYVQFTDASLYDIGSSDDFTIEFFFNPTTSAINDYQYLFGNYVGTSGPYMTIQADLRSSGKDFNFYYGNGAAYNFGPATDDFVAGQWYHVAINRVSGNLRFFLDGTQLGSTQTSNTQSWNNNDVRIGQGQSNGTNGFDGYISNARMVVGSAVYADGASITVPTATLTDVTNTKLLALTTSTITQDASSNNVTGTLSGSGYFSSELSPFADFNFYDDTSGNGNNFTATNLAAHDVVLDSPTNNFATLNENDEIGLNAFGEGSLRYSGASASSFGITRATFSASNHKCYWETYGASYPTGDVRFGLMQTGQRLVGSASDYLGLQSTYPGSVAFEPANGKVRQSDGTYSSVYTTASGGDVINHAFDPETGKYYVGINGTYINSGDPAAGTGNIDTLSTTDTFAPAVSDTATGNKYFNFGQDGSFAGNKTSGGYSDANGNGDFFNQPPTGFLALCSASIPEPSIGPNSTTTSDQNFNTVLWTGNGSTQSITGVGFSPDFVWNKARSTAQRHALWDTVRGATKILNSDATDAETTSSGLTSFDADGWTTGSSYNQSGYTFASWNWKAGGTAVSNTDGSITSSVSANQDAGFSICTWTSTASTGTVGHGLNSAPELIIAKPRNASGTNWYVMHTPGGVVPANQILNLDSTAAKFTPGVAHFNSTYPTSTVFSIGGYLGTGTAPNNDKLAYCFHSVEGFSKVGSYVGNGSTDGTFVYTGFKPAFVLTKESSSTSGWNLRDNKRSPENVVNEALQADTTGAELTSGYDVDFLSNGFKLRTSLSDSNTSGQTYIYLAFAEQPFKYANAR